MSKQQIRPARPLTGFLVLVGGLIAAAGCGGDGAKEFGGGGESGGPMGNTGGANGASGGRSGGGTGGETGTGSGGAVATGGVSGSGGAIASGGVSGSGGRANTGGTSGTGGMFGTGGTGTGASGGRGGTGATGSGGRANTGGAPGTGGAPRTGGAPGTGGSGTSICDGIAADYQAEMPNARACNTITHITVPQCQAMAASTLGCGSNCIVYVQDNSRLTELNKKWNNAGCPDMIRLCPAIVCVDAKPGHCYATAGSVAAQCQAGPRN